MENIKVLLKKRGQSIKVLISNLGQKLSFRTNHSLGVQIQPSSMIFRAQTNTDNQISFFTGSVIAHVANTFQTDHQLGLKSLTQVSGLHQIVGANTLGIPTRLHSVATSPTLTVSYGIGLVGKVSSSSIKSKMTEDNVLGIAHSAGVLSIYEIRMSHAIGIPITVEYLSIGTYNPLREFDSDTLHVIDNRTLKDLDMKEGV